MQLWEQVGKTMEGCCIYPVLLFTDLGNAFCSLHFPKHRIFFQAWSLLPLGVFLPGLPT